MNPTKQLILEIMPLQLYGEAYFRKYTERYTVYRDELIPLRKYIVYRDTLIPPVLTNLRGITIMDAGIINVPNIPKQLLNTAPSISSLDKYIYRNLELNNE